MTAPRATEIPVLALDLALRRLERIDRGLARIVELRAFGGLTIEEAAHVLNVSPSTVKRDWRTAKAWLTRELGSRDNRESNDRRSLATCQGVVRSGRRPAAVGTLGVPWSAATPATTSCVARSKRCSRPTRGRRRSRDNGRSRPTRCSPSCDGAQPTAHLGDHASPGLTAGSRVGNYDVIAPLGAGGMGEVYRAHDARLGRDVAVKILPRAFTTDPDRLARFAREARVLASLNHPHIAGIYGIEEIGDGTRARARAGRGTDARRSDQRGSAARAGSARYRTTDRRRALGRSRQGHRPPRPQAGQREADAIGVVKVLDFGLAKADPDGDAAQVAHSPTITISATTRHHPRNRRLHESRAGARKIRRQALRHLGVWLRALRDAHRSQSVRS